MAAVPVDKAQRKGLKKHKDNGTYYTEVGVTEKKAKKEKKAKETESKSSEGSDKREVKLPPKKLPPVVAEKKEKEKETETKSNEGAGKREVLVIEEVTTRAAALEMLASKGVGAGLSMRNTIAQIKAEAEAYFIEFPKL